MGPQEEAPSPVKGLCVSLAPRSDFRSFRTLRALLLRAHSGPLEIPLHPRARSPPAAHVISTSPNPGAEMPLPDGAPGARVADAEAAPKRAPLRGGLPGFTGEGVGHWAAATRNEAANEVMGPRARSQPKGQRERTREGLGEPKELQLEAPQALRALETRSRVLTPEASRGQGGAAPGVSEPVAGTKAC